MKTRQHSDWGVEMNYGRELLKGNTDSLLLCLISRQPTYGYKIVKELEKRSNGYFLFKEGTLYPVLYRLEGAGLIEPRWETQERGVPRKYYRLTTKGARRLEEMIAEWQEFAAALNRLLKSEGKS